MPPDFYELPMSFWELAATDLRGRIITVEEVGGVQLWSMEVCYAQKGEGDIIVMSYRRIPGIKSWHCPPMMEDELSVCLFEDIRYNHNNDISFIVNRGADRYLYTLFATWAN